jgi:hypothetical protein
VYGLKSFVPAKESNQDAFAVNQTSPLSLSPVSSLPSSSSSPVNPTFPAFSTAFPETAQDSSPLLTIPPNTSHDINRDMQTNSPSTHTSFLPLSPGTAFLSNAQPAAASQRDFPCITTPSSMDEYHQYGAPAGLFSGVSKLDFAAIQSPHQDNPRVLGTFLGRSVCGDTSTQTTSLADSITKPKKLAASSLSHSDYRDTQDQELIG